MSNLMQHTPISNGTDNHKTRSTDRKVTETATPGTIVGVIKKVLSEAEAMTLNEVYDQIVSRHLYAFKAADPRSVVRSQLRRHCLELNFPTASPVKFFSLIGSDRYRLISDKGVRQTRTVSSKPKADEIPEEVIDEAYKEHLSALRQELKLKILDNHPAFFEKLVIELLTGMGYGGSDPTLAMHTGGPGDGGIDGIIKEDKLGLEKIYIQAKRYALDREVKRTEVQRFAGAMNKVRKGVFITTASFAKNALQFASGHEKSISLIGGDLLCNLMISHGIGVAQVKNYAVMQVDSDYFESGT